MELFHEYKNRYFNLVFKLLNLAKDGLSEEEILEIIDKEAYDEKVIGKDFITFEGLILNHYSDEENINLLKKIDEKYYPILNDSKETPLKVRFTNIEKQWLKAMLNENMAREFLGEKLVVKLEKALENVQAIEGEVIEKTNTLLKEEDKDFNSLKGFFFIAIEGIIKNCPIRYTNVDKNGSEHKDKLALPIRIEYSLKDENLRLSLYSLDEDRPIMVLLKNIKSIALERNIKVDKSREVLLMQLKDKKYSKEPIVLELIDRKMAMERCFMGFSSYERSTRSLGDNKYEVKIYYYTFDEDEVIRKILSLGPYVVVKSPENIRNKIIVIICEGAAIDI